MTKIIEWTVETLDNKSAFMRNIASNTTIKHKNSIIEEVLDKIRAEIEELYSIDEGLSFDPQISRDDVLQIIDKYKEESEI